MRYDVFISYRRNGGTEIARAIKAELEKMGYSVFLDFDSLHDGQFDKRISEAISKSDVFMLVLSPNALDSCDNEEDWLRKEIEYAIQTQRHIVPINPDRKFLQFPVTLPDSLKNQLPKIQISDLMLGQLFQASLEKVIKERILPYINQAEFSTNLHIKASENCRFFSFHELQGELKANVFTCYSLKKGRYMFSFITDDNKTKEVEYEVTDKTDDYLIIEFDHNRRSITRRRWITLFSTILILSTLCCLFLFKHNPTIPINSSEPIVRISEDKSTYTVGDVPFEFVYVEGGQFLMGATDSMCAEADEFPAHIVNVPSFWIGKYPVTQKQWKCIMGNNPSVYTENGDNHPVENVTWDDALGFIRRFNKITGIEFAMPTEAEWEYAARGGKQSKGFTYSGGNNPDSVGWFKDNSGIPTHEVGLKAGNELGIYDMSGNVWEWCQDFYDPNYYSNCFDSISPKGPQGSPNPSTRVMVMRGGSIQLDKKAMRVSNRDRLERDGHDHDIGFRLILRVKPF